MVFMKNNTKDILITKNEKCMVWTGYTVLVFALLLLSGTISSGFHFIDDHEIIRINQELSVQGDSLISCIIRWVGSDLNIRFRPFYYILRVIWTAILGDNFTAWSVLKGAETVITMTFLYFCARLLKCNKLVSVFFSATIMVGTQAAVWWWLGPQEGIGMLFFAIGFFFLINYMNFNKSNDKYLSILFFVISSLTKESFVILIPAVVFYAVFLGEGQTWSYKQVANSIRQKGDFVLIMLLTFIVEIFVIFFWVGTNQIEYAGIDATLKLGDYIRNILYSLKNELFIFSLWGTILLVLVCGGENYKQVLFLLKEFIFSMLVMLPQAILYAKSGMGQRYLLPWTFGFAYFWVISYSTKIVLSNMKKKIYYILFFTFIFLQSLVTIRGAVNFTEEGKNVNSMLNYVYELNQDDENVLIAFSVETNLSITVWMDAHGLENVYTYIDGAAVYQYPSKMKKTASLNSIEYILLNQNNNYLEGIVNLADFERKDFYSYSLYTRK